MGGQKSDLLRGTLALIVLKTLALEPMHGLAIARRIRQVTGGVFDVPTGSLFPALHRLEQDGWIAGEWGDSENNRRAKFYRLTPAGRRRLGEEHENWQHVATAIAALLAAT